MARSTKSWRPGRPNVFNKNHRRHCVSAVRKLGYTGAQEALRDEGGVFSTISIPTLMRFVSDHNDEVKASKKGKPIVLKPGRRVA